MILASNLASCGPPEILSFFIQIPLAYLISKTYNQIKRSMGPISFCHFRGMKMKYSRSGNYILVVLVCIVLVVVSAAIFGGGAKKSEVPQNTSLAGSENPAVTSPALTAAATAPPKTSAPAATPLPNNGKPDVPEMKKADDDFFSDSVFIGNSLVDGLYLYGGVSTCDWLSGTGLSIYNIAAQKLSDKHGGTCTVMSALGAKQYGKVYILLGINEIGSSIDSFSKSYGEILSKIRALQPSADIYVMNMTLSETALAKAISWVTMTIVIFSSASCLITFSTSPVSSGSSALVGSSKNSISGFMARARAMATRCCCPPESWQG